MLWAAVPSRMAARAPEGGALLTDVAGISNEGQREGHCSSELVRHGDELRRHFISCGCAGNPGGNSNGYLGCKSDPEVVAHGAAASNSLKQNEWSYCRTNKAPSEIVLMAIQGCCRVEYLNM
jgi:hypothetical protein